MVSLCLSVDWCLTQVARWGLARPLLFRLLPRIRTWLTDDGVVAARRLFTTYRGRVTCYARIVFAGVSFQPHLIIDSYLNILTDCNSSGRVGGVAGSARNDLHVRFRNIQRRHLRNVDVAGCAPYVMIICIVPEFKGKALRQVYRPILKPSRGIRRELRRLSDLQFSRLVIRLREMTSVTVIFRWLLRLPVTIETSCVSVGCTFSGNRLESTGLYPFERLVAWDAFQRQRDRPARVREMAGGTSIRCLRRLIIESSCIE